MMFRMTLGLSSRRMMDVKSNGKRGKKWWSRAACASAMLALSLATGCINQPAMLAPNKQKVIDRKVVEYPTGYSLVLMAENINAPTAMAFDADQGNILIAESGADGTEPHIFGYKLSDGSYFNVYPYARTVSFYPDGQNHLVMYGPIGGIVVHQGKIYVSHRDRELKGVITAIDYEGHSQTIVANLPAQGDYGVTDLAIGPNGRLYFGVGTATNSGVVGVDNWDAGWLKRFPDLHDVPFVPSGTQLLHLLGLRFDSLNPRAGLGGGATKAVTSGFQPFDVSNQTIVRGGDKPNGAIYSVNVDGGDQKVEASGLHNPRGLSFNEYGRLYITNDGMEMRGTRPIKDDKDSLIRVGFGTNYLWPDFTTDLQPVTKDEYQPPTDLIIRTGYDRVSFLIDHERSGIRPPDPSAVAGVFPSLSGAAKFDFVPASGPYKQFRSNAIVALDGDRAPFATSGQKLLNRVGFKIVRVDLDTKTVKDFIRNTEGVPASMQHFGTVALERPIDVKFGPDGSLYILDFGHMDNNGAIPRIYPKTGRLLKLMPVPENPTTQSGR